MRTRILVPLVLLALADPCLGQQPVSPRNLYERLLCVAPMVGAGTEEDPRRPMYVPLPPKPGEETVKSGIIAFASQVSDDGRFALVELVARDRSAFSAILADRNPEVKVFEKGKAKRQDIEREFQKHKRDFSLDRFEVNVP